MKLRQDDLGHEVISRQGPLTHAAERIDRTMMKPILLIALAALTHVSMAFVPLAHSRRLITVRRQSSLARTAAVGVSMNLFERFGRVAKANINELLNKMEDPEKVMNQAVDDLQKDLVKIRQSYAEVMATQKRMEKQRAAAEQLSNEWLSRAQLALQNEDEELAREALSRKQTAAEQAATLAMQLETQAASLNQLYDSMQQLEAKIVEAKAMKEQYVARARTAATSTKVNDMLAGVGENSMGAFDRMKEKVEALETTAEVSSSMLGAAEDVSLESKFKALEGGSSVDDELAQMKAGLALPGTSATETASLPGDSAVEDELAKLRKEMEE